MVAEENAEVNNFITEDASFTGDILSLTDEKKNIFDPMVKKIVDELKEQDIFNDKSAQPLSKNIEGMDCKIFCNYNKQGAYENSEYLTLRVDVPYLMDKNGSLYFYILQYNLDGYSYVTVEGAIIYGNKKKFIYKDFGGKLKD